MKVNPPTGKYRIFIVDDHPLVREWLTNLINQQPDLEVCGEAEEAPGAVSGILEAKPNLAIVDLSLKEGSGLEVIKSLRTACREVPIIVLSMHEESFYAERALRAGAMGYVMKKETSKKITTAIRTVLNGKIYVSETFAATVAKRLVNGRHQIATRQIELLSDRELQIFRFLGEGKTTGQIADNLHISLKTVQSYCARIKEKLQLANATELLREAVRWYDAEAAL